MAEATVTLRRWSALALRLLLLITLSFAIGARPATAHSILRDSETESLFNDMSRAFLEAAAIMVKKVLSVSLNTKAFNAFFHG